MAGDFCVRTARRRSEVWIDFVLNVCNSPRMGVCGYEGSEIYPDQFEQDWQ